MAYVMQVALTVLMFCFVYLCFAIADMYEEWDFYNGYIEFMDELWANASPDLSSTGETDEV